MERSEVSSFPNWWGHMNHGEESRNYQVPPPTKIGTRESLVESLDERGRRGRGDSIPQYV